MPEFVYDVPLRTLALWFAATAVVAVLVGLLVVKPILRLLLGGGPDLNDAISLGTAGFNLFYALLLGLLTVSAYQNNERVREYILREATAVGALYADMNAYPEPTRGEVKELLRDYTLFTVLKDWPAHREGEFLNGGAHRAEAMRQRLAAYEPATVSQEIFHRQTVAAFQEFTAARQARLTGVTVGIPPVLWYAVLVGALINVVLLVMLRIRLRQHLFLATVTAFFLGVILFVIVALDRPLRGESGIAPDPFELIWERQMIWDEPLT
jgi:hypothetical protein